MKDEILICCLIHLLNSITVWIVYEKKWGKETKRKRKWGEKDTEAKDFSAAVKCTLSLNVQEFKTAGGPF